MLMSDLPESDAAFQDQILPLVSRTFALTIPQLPAALCTPVTSAYLLCRIADTIEDEPGLSAADTQRFLRRFTAVVQGREDAQRFAAEVVPHLGASTLAAERDLV
ncbi:squalene/phytoene synthase, partial [mine drainage metagenome]